MLLVYVVFGNMSMTHKPIKDKAGKVIGVALNVLFDPDPLPSASGKTLIDFSTRGNRKIDVDGTEVTVGLNVYHRP